ncbi:type IV secretory system conjugative DNA transfer family protein [Tessaracoccus rhinocerotis]|nr:DUF87 domain-containing protein [Tessaracoccus rhinocerotis]
MGTESIEITELLRSPDAGMTAMLSVRRLVHAVAEWSPDVGLDVTFASHDNHRVLLFAKYGGEQPGWDSDLAWALEHSAAVGPTRAEVPPGDSPDWGSVVEVRPTRAVKPSISGFMVPPSTDDDDDPLGPDRVDPFLRRQLTRLRTPWPMSMNDSLHSTAELLARHPELMIRFRLSAATAAETDMLATTMLRTWTGDDGELFPYLGTPIRLRALLASTTGDVPARARALARRWAVGLTVAPVPPDEAPSAWDGEVDSLYGRTEPEGVALSLLRLPATGNRPFPGMRTRHPKTKLRPLDPVPPAPPTPIRLGKAVTVTDDEVDVAVDVQDLRRHLYVEGQSGSGKSTLIAALVHELIAKGYGCTFLDPHGTTIDLILRELPADAGSNFLVRHQDAEHIPLDILTGTVEETEVVVDDFAEMVQNMYDRGNTGIVGPRWRRWFSLLAQATRAVMGDAASLVAVTEIGSDVALVKNLAEAVRPLDRMLHQTLMTEIVNNRSQEAGDMQAWCVSKLNPVIQSRYMRAILGTGYDAVDVTELMDDGRSLLVDLATPTLGTQSSRLLGALWLLKHQMAMGRRRTDRPHVIIVDEAHLFQYGSLPKLLAEGRKFGIGVVVATQHLSQLREDLQDSLESNAGSFISLGTGLKDAQRASLRLDGWPVEELVRLPSLTGAATLSRDGTRTEPFSLRVDHHDVIAALGIRDSKVSQQVALDMDSFSRRRLREPYQTHPIYDAARINAFLSSAARPSSTPRPTGANSSFIQDWLAKRAEMRAGGIPPGPVSQASVLEVE